MRAISVPGIIASILCIQLLISSISTQSLGGPFGVFGQEVCDPNSATISRDSSGPVVQALQTILMQLQFDPGSIDGIFGNTTENAVMLFQQANGLDVDGVVGPNTWSKLCEAVTSVPSPLNQPVTTEESQPSQPLETPTTECDPNSATISRDSSGPVVQALQTILMQLQFDPGSIDGIFGNTTENAVMLFQQANGLDVDGVVGPNTWSKLCEAVTSVITGVQSTSQTGDQLNENPNESSQQQLTDGVVQDFPPLNFPPLQPLQPAGNEGPQSSTVAQGTECDPNEKTISKLKQSNGPVVVRLQNLLLERGFDPGPIDGIFGDKTEAAVKAFQEANGLEVDGVVGPKTWLALCESLPVISQPTFPTPPVIPIGEICGDGIDNNLDGITDENCVPETPVGPQQCLPGEEPGTTTLSLTSAGCVTSAPELPAPCTNTQQHSLQFFQHNTSPWKFDFGVIDGRGLVLQDITAGIKHLQSWSAPQFRIATTDGKNRLVTFCGASDTQRPLVETDEASFHRISWGYDKTMDNGVLSIEYNVLVSTKPFFPNSCETFSGNDCFKLLPLVKYTWTSPSTHIAQLEAFIKLDYGDQRGVAVF